MNPARLRLVEFSASLPVLYGSDARVGRAARVARTKTEIVGPSGLHWQVRLLILPSGMRPPPPSEMLALADPATGGTPLPLGGLLAGLALPFLPLVGLLHAVLGVRSLRLPTPSPARYRTARPA